MDLIYIQLLLVCLIIICILCYLLSNKNQNKEIVTKGKDNNSIIIKEETPSYFPAIQIIENNDIIPSNKSLIKNEVVKNTLSKIDNVVPNLSNIVRNSKSATKLLKNGKVLFSASVEDTNKMLSAGSNKFYGTQISKVPGQNKKLFSGQTQFTKETGLTKDLTKQQLTNVGMNVASMVVGQYYISEINDKLEDIKNSIDNISNFQDSEYLSKLLHICSKINEITENQNDILSNDEVRKNAYSDIKNIETKCAELLGQANIQISKYITDNELNSKNYFKKVKEI